MPRSKELEKRIYPSFGRCIFCRSPNDLTDEHIVPEALSGVAQMLIRAGSCRKCNNFANETYEQRSLRTDFAAVRHILELRRERRGKGQKPRELPPVAFFNATMSPSDAFDQLLPVEHYPPVYVYLVHEPAGRIVGIDRSGGSVGPRVGFLNLGLKRITPGYVTIKTDSLAGDQEMVVAKMAYCWAVAERGLDAFDTSDLIDLLMGRRSDVFNFVGRPVEQGLFPRLRLHRFYFRKRGNLNTVIVHLFASFGGPKHEVAIGPDM